VEFAICNEMFEGRTFAEVCRLAADLGYEGVEVAPFTVAESIEDAGAAVRRDMRRAAAEAGLGIVGLHWLLASPSGLHLNNRDSAVRGRTEKYLEALIDFCFDIGGRTLVFGSPRQRNVLPGQTYEEAWENAVRVFGRLAPRAFDRGVCLCIEALGPKETNFINTAAEARRLVDAVDHPGFGLMLDVKGMSDDEEPIPDIIRRHADRMEHFHANDATTRGPGFGQTDFAPIGAALREVGYDRWVSVEPLDFRPDAETVARESLPYLKEHLLGREPSP
jgi:sugar phosphate isomerase/epimerase